MWLATNDYNDAVQEFLTKNLPQQDRDNSRDFAETASSAQFSVYKCFYSLLLLLLLLQSTGRIGCNGLAIFNQLSLLPSVGKTVSIRLPSVATG